MTVFVDPLASWGTSKTWRHKQSCHMYTDGDVAELHALAAKIGLQRSWFQSHKAVPHYDLTANKRQQAIAHGAVEVDWQHLARLINSKKGRA